MIAPLLLFGPGFLIERALPIALPWAARPALWLGCSLSVIPLLHEWCWALGVPLTTPWLALAIVGCGGSIIWHCWNDKRQQKAAASPWKTMLVSGALAATVVTTLALRFHEIRNETLPLWVDSVHHGLLIRVINETGGPPVSLRPYLPVDELPYHWGYHAVMSTLMRLAGLSLPQTLLWGGQLLNGLQVLPVAALATLLWRSRVAGLAAAVVAGLVSLMPAYLVTWGRYTLLDGLLLLPPLLIVALSGLRRSTAAAWIYCALLLSGLVLTHYIVTVFAVALLPLLVLWHLALDPQQPDDAAPSPRHHALAPLLSLAAAGLGAGLLAGPWLLLLARRVLTRYVAVPSDLQGGGDYNAFSTGLLWAGQNRLLFALAGLALLLTFWRRRSAGVLLVCWGLLLLLLANPDVLGLPPTWLVTNTEVLVSLYIPLAATIGGGAQVLWAIAGGEGSRGYPWAGPVALVGLVASGVLGIANQGEVINPVTRIAGPGDLAAISWVAEHTPANARFLTSAAPWLPDAERGADGGWWLLPLAGRWVSTPPVMFTYGPPAEVRAIQARTRQVAALTAEQQTIVEELVRREQITHVYIGAGAGSLPAALFDNNPSYSRVYEQDGVIILARGP